MTLPLMLFAAGFGTRMGALTADRPKPLVRVAGKTLLDHALDVADSAGAAPIVANLHYRGDQIRAHLANRADISFSEEPGQILETGGGMRQALPLLGKSPAFTLNTDAVWTGENPLVQLLAAWQPERMDALLLLLPVDRVTGFSVRADFAVGPDGALRRGGGDETHAYLGAQIIKTPMLRDVDAQVFSLNAVWDRMIAGGRAFGIVHRGGWCDVGRPEGIALAEAMLQKAMAW
jgi:N-acetyl-alpha-D-muramate 1-phosphate uridylyltransferase